MNKLLLSLALCFSVQAFGAEKVPDKYQAIFKTTKGEFTILVDKKLAPIGAERFYELIKSHYYDKSKFFRVVDGFVVQFGIAANPEISSKWKNKNLKDDLVATSNAPGTISFATAGPNTRTTQVFINLGNNSTLDRMGFAPFGKVEKGMDVVKSLYGGYGDDPTPLQEEMHKSGNAFLEKTFPKLDSIIETKIQIAK